MADKHDIALHLDSLLGDLAAQGFYFGVDDHLRIAAFLAQVVEQPRPLETLKFQLAALVAHSAEEQQKFYRAFDALVRQSLDDFSEEEENDQPATGLPIAPPEKNVAEPLPEILAPNAGRPSGAVPVARSIQGRSGPVRIELISFPATFWRIWNTARIDAATVSLREKEWTPTTEWDLPASIRYTIQQGGIPHLVSRQRKRMPQYLFLIDQRSTEDHLAGFYAELALEMRRRDLAAEYYFYHDIPGRCWRDRRNPRTYTSIQRLQNEYDGYKLLIVGDANGLLDRPYLRPSSLAHEVAENWRNVALLSPKSTAEWGRPELSLCQLFPVVPATAEGLDTLVHQWSADEILTPDYWRSALPASSAPSIELEIAPEEEEEVIDQLKYYLGRDGFHWLCAAATYPALFWRLTARYNDESIVPRSDLAERDQNQIWQNTLLKISRLGWLREGFIPEEIRLKLQEMLPEEKVGPVRHQLLEVLELNRDQVPEHSYAAADYAFAVARYAFEEASNDPQISAEERAKKEAALRKAIASIAYSDVQDPAGQRLWSQQSIHWPPVPDAPGLHVLWVDDEPKNNVRFQNELNESLHGIFTNATSTEEALAALAGRGFDLIISDISRLRRDDEGMKMMRAFQEKGVPTPVIFYTTSAMVNRYEAELMELGAAGVFSSHEQVRKFVGERVMAKQQRKNDLFASPPFEGVTQSQQQSSAPPRTENPRTAEQLMDLAEETMKNKDYKVAEETYQQALVLFTENKDDAGRANTHQALGKLYVAINNLESALQHFKSASTLYLLLNFNPAYAYILMDIGGVQQKMGSLADAQKSYEEALEILEDLGDEENTEEVRKALFSIAYANKYPNGPPEMPEVRLKKEIQRLIAEGWTETALNLLVEVSSEAVALKERYVSMRQQLQNVEIDAKNWQAEQDRINEKILDIANNLEANSNVPGLTANGPDTQQGFILYYIPSTMQVDEKFRCTVRIAATSELLQEDWEARPLDVQQAIEIAETMAVELVNAGADETYEWAFNIKRDPPRLPSKQKVNQSRYAEWTFDVEPKRTGTYQLLLNATLSEKRTTTIFKIKVTVTKRLRKNPKQATPPRTKRKK